MNKADKYLKETITEILEEGQWDKEPRTRWADNTPAHSKFVTQKVYQYDISKLYRDFIEQIENKVYVKFFLICAFPK